MPEYQWALGNGEIVSADYNRATDSLSSEQVRTELLSAFEQFGHIVHCESVSDNLSEVYEVTFEETEQDKVIICAKGTTPGGRSNLNDEQRTQQKSKYINYAFGQMQSGHLAVQLGVYRRDGQTIFCAWKLKSSTAGAETPISKQIKIATIAQAMKEGFVQQDKGSGEYACAFRKEFMYFYIRNAEWIHGSLVTELANHNEPLPDASIDNEAAFKAWFEELERDNGEHYSENTRNQYISALRAVSTTFGDAIAPFSSIFEIDDIEVFERAEAAIKADDGFEEFNRNRGNGSLSAGLDLYKRFLVEQRSVVQEIHYNTGYQSEFARNRILFGAPGTGKSFTLNCEKDILLTDGGEYERVTFHPDYSYANFVGTYKPVPCKDSDGKDAITYSYVPGPFMRTYVKALLNSRTDAPKPFLLVIEEINRANVAAVFGDVFQLLDRGDDEVSEYPIQASEDIKKYLAGELGGNPDDYAEIRIPDNMFIWATMNSADQGVFPMDTAFKRRWDFTYLGIDDSEAGIVGKKVILGQSDYRRIVEWNALRKAINNELLTYKVNEDKLMGPYFISKKNLPDGEMIDPAVFTRIFKNKVIMYLFDDAAKQKRITLFGGCDEKAKNQYSKICREFDTKGVYIFCEGISSLFIDNFPEDDGE
ncbi:McrB family protein [Intestinibacillus massiliensis]|uniref:McrB family protein n=1 Tax=Intestinibacillus massiliensis TaxID=1871029 RepID=UPI000B35488E|nr:AAA family ATPase [Intestinibacillus massiliensis]